MTEITIVNMVGISKLGENFDLSTISMALENAEYEPEQFPGMVFRIKNPKAAFLIFQSGKVVCTGTTNLDQAQSALNIAVKKLDEVGVTVLPDPEIEIVNIVASADIGTELNLNQVAIALGLENIEYEPEQFPGLVYRLRVPKVVLLLFSTGKIICTGARNRTDLEQAVANLQSELTNLGFL